MLGEVWAEIFFKYEKSKSMLDVLRMVLGESPRREVSGDHGDTLA
jgi:hypothetical protein